MEHELKILTHALCNLKMQEIQHKNTMHMLGAMCSMLGGGGGFGGGR
jgi:hypothetical protein